MVEFCTFCGKYVEIVSDRDVWGISKSSSKEFEFVCDKCINNKLNFGEPIKSGCIYCDDEPDYNLKRYTPEPTNMGYSCFANRGTRPMVCSKHFEAIKKDDRDHTLAIENALSDSEDIQPPKILIPDSIGQDEGSHLEYKETFQYNVHTDQSDKSLKSEITKEVAAFGNNEREVVVIGVRDDDKKITGLERDYNSMGVKWDGFALQVGDVITSNVGNAFAAEYTSIRKSTTEKKVVCAIEVDPSPNPLFADTDEADNVFYVRQDSSSRPLEGDEMAKHVSNH
jgi:hypothetical protein